MHLSNNMQPYYGQGGVGGQQGGYGYPQGVGMRSQAQSLGYEYQLPSQQYSAQPFWGAWDLANAQYGGSRLERGFFDSIISGLSGFFGSRHLSEQAAHEAHRKVYYMGEGGKSGTKTLGGAAAYQAYLIWDRDHHSAYHSFPTHENRERLVGLAVAELFNIWDRVEPRRDGRARQEEAAEYAAATAKHLFDRHYDLSGGSSRRLSGRGYDGDDSDDEYERRRRHQRRSMEYGQYRPGTADLAGAQQAVPPGMMGQQGMMQPGMMQPGMMQPGMQPGMMQTGMMQPGMMQQGMMQPGMGSQGMYPQGMMPGMQGMQGMGGMGMQGMMPQQTMGMGGMMQPGGMHPGSMTMGEAQAMPGMHPYSYGQQHGVAYGNQPIDSMGNAMYPGQHRSWYGGMGGRGGGY